MSYFAFSWVTIVIGAGGVLAIGGLVGWGVIVLERRNRAEQRGERIQQAVGEAFAREPALAGGSIVPVASFPVGGRPTLELTGYAPSAEARARAVRVAERELRRLRPGMEVIDRLDIVPSLAERGRRPA